MPDHKRLTETTVFNLPTGKTPQYYWDRIDAASVRGLFVRVQVSGTRSYFVSYRFPGAPKEHRLHLGRVGDITLADARAKALQARQAAARGDDPKAGNPVHTDSFAACVESWTAIEQQGRKELISADRTKQHVLTTCARWKSRPIGSLRYGEIDDLLSTYAIALDLFLPRLLLGFGLLLVALVLLPFEFGRGEGRT